jgi:hypothetical protein
MPCATSGLLVCLSRPQMRRAQIRRIPLTLFVVLDLRGQNDLATVVAIEEVAERAASGCRRV